MWPHFTRGSLAIHDSLVRPTATYRAPLRPLGLLNLRMVLCAPPSLWPAPSCAPIEKPPAAPAALGVASTFAPPKGDESGKPGVPAAAPKSKPDGLAGAPLLGRP